MAARILVISLFLSALLMLAAHAVLETVSLPIAAAALPSPTPTVTLTPTVSPTATPTVISPTPMSTPTVTPLPTPTATVVPPRGTTTTVPSPLVVTTTVARHRHRHRYRHYHHHRHHRRRLEKPRPTPTTTVVTTIHATATGRNHKRWHVHQRSQAHHRQQRRAKGVPTPTRTPHLHHPRLKITLNIGNTISPVLCSGPSTPHARPFLIPPYHGFVPIISYFDHDLPDFGQDGLIQLANGMSIRVGPPNSPFPTAADFPAYWSGRLRQYIYYDGHNGYDFGLVYQPVYAAAAGRVIFAGWNYPDAPTHGYGQMVMIDHGHGYITLYGHLSHILVHRGQHVHAGQEIGVSGNTGHSSGPHLHFTVFHNCTPTDPFGWSGPGPDPLALYQGESSTYLWRRSPALLDLPPNWPGLAAQSAPPVPELVTLSLPSSPSLMRLLDQLDSERHTLATALARHHIVAHYDWTAAAFLLPHAPPPAVLYALPNVASVTMLDGDNLDMARESLTASLAQLLASVQPRDQLVGGPWHAFVFHYQGQTFLLGRGPVHERLQFRLLHRVGGRLITPPLTPMVVMSNTSGTFAVPITQHLSHSTPIVLLTSSSRTVLSPPQHHVSESTVVEKYAGQRENRQPLRLLSSSASQRTHLPPTLYLIPLFILIGAVMLLWRERWFSRLISANTEERGPKSND